jgi:hypothetical protein
MRSVKVTHVLHKDVPEVWGAINKPEFIATYFASFKPLPPRLSARWTKKDFQTSGDFFSLGDSIELIGKNITVISFTVRDSQENSMLEIANELDDSKNTINFVFKSTFQLASYGEGRTQVVTTLVLISKNWFVELLSLCIPIRWIYYLGIKRALKKLGQ